MKLFKKRETGAGLTTSPAASLEKSNSHQQSPTPSTSSTNPVASAATAHTNASLNQNNVRESVAPDGAVRSNNPRESTRDGPREMREGHRETQTGRDGKEVTYPWSSRPLSNKNPFPRYGHATNAQSGKDGGIYVFGGLVRDAAMNDLWLVTPQDMQAKPVITTGEQPSPRVGHAALLIGNAFIVFGGDTKLSGNDSNANNDDALYLLNTTTRIWTVAKVAGARPSGRYGHTLNMLGPKVLVFGGQVEGFFFNDLVAFDLNTLNRASPRWELITPLEGCEPPPSRTNHIAIAHNDKLYVFGGTNGLEWYNDMWRFDPVTRAWQMLKCSGFVPQPREGHSAALVGDVIYVFGGRDVDGNDLGDLSAFKISSSRWFTFQNMGPCPSPRSGHALCSVGKKIYVVGGEGASIRGDEQHAYILDTTKIRYPGESKSAQKLNELTSGNSREAPLDGGALPPRNIPPDVSNQPSIRSVSGQSTTAPSRLPQISGQRSMLPEFSQNQSQVPRRGSVNPMNQSRTDSPGQRNVSMPNPFNGTNDTKGKAPKRSGSLDSMMDHSETTPQQPAPAIAREDKSLNRARSMEEMKMKKSKKHIESESLRETAQIKENGSVVELAPALRHIDSGIIPTQSTTSTNAASDSTAPIPASQSTMAQTNPFYSRAQQNGARAISPVHSSQQAVSRTDEGIIPRQENDMRIAWLEAELNLARKSGYVVSDKSQDSAVAQPGTKPDALENLIGLRNQLLAMQAEIDAAKAKSDAAIATALSERDAALRETALERARNSAMVNMDGERLRDLDLQRSHELESQLLQSTNESKALSSQLSTLQNELAATRRTRESHDELLEKHSRAAEEAHERHASLLTEHNTMQTLLIETQGQAQEHRAMRLQAESALAERENHAEKLKELESTHAQHLLVHQATSAAITAVTARATQAESAINEEKSKSAVLRDQLLQLQAQLEAAKAEAANLSTLREESEKSMLAARKEAELAHTALSSGINDLVQQQQSRGPHDPVHHQKTLETLQRELSETRDLHATTTSTIDSHVQALHVAQTRVQELQNSHVKQTHDMLALQRQVATSHNELQDLQAKHVALQESHTTKQAELDESLLKCASLQQIMSSRPSRRDSIERRRSRNFSPMPLTNGRTSQTSDAPRSREIEAKLPEAGQALNLHSDTSAAIEIPDNATPANTEAEPRLEAEGKTRKSIDEHSASRPHSATSNGEPGTRRESFLRNSNKDVQLAQARAAEAERQLAESTQNFKERLSQLESDYQSAVHYVKGTEKMLRRMKEELGKYKTANAKLQTQLEQTTNAPRSLEADAGPDVTHMQTQLTSITTERDAMTKELADLKAHLDTTMATHGAKVSELERQLATHQESARSMDDHAARTKQLQEELEEAHLATRKLEFENRELERGMQESEGKVKLLLDQFEHSVDTYRRQSVLVSDNHHDRVRDSTGSGSDVLAPPLLGSQSTKQTSSTLDLLAHELDQLRTDFEGSRRTIYRSSAGSIYDGQSQV